MAKSKQAKKSNKNLTDQDIAIRAKVEKTIKEYSHAKASIRKYKGQIEIFKTWSKNGVNIEQFEIETIDEDLCYKICKYINDRAINNRFLVIIAEFWIKGKYGIKPLKSFTAEDKKMLDQDDKMRYWKWSRIGKAVNAFIGSFRQQCEQFQTFYQPLLEQNIDPKKRTMNQNNLNDLLKSITQAE